MAKGYKIPKKVAGVKIPRALRKSKLIQEFLKNPDNRQMISSALMAAGGAIATVLAEHRPGAKQIRHAADGAGDAGAAAAGTVQSAAHVITDVVAGAARSLASGLTPPHGAQKHEGHKKGHDIGDMGPHNRH